MQIFDTHTHLNDTCFKGKENWYYQHAHKLGVTEMAIVGSNYQLNQEAIRLAEHYRGLYAVIGWHPEEVAEFDHQAIQWLTRYHEHSKVVAIGEIGLDYHWQIQTKKRQQEIFAEQLALAKKWHLPVAIHSREATADTYALLKEAALPQGQIIMHSFNVEEPNWADRFLELGCYLSYSGVVTFKNAPLVRAALARTPLERLLVETDAPYLTPVPYRGRQNEPGYTAYTLAFIADYLKVSRADLAAQTTANAHQVYQIGEGGKSYDN